MSNLVTQPEATKEAIARPSFQIASDETEGTAVQIQTACPLDDANQFVLSRCLQDNPNAIR
jgi:hypothetical protein